MIPVLDHIVYCSTDLEQSIKNMHDLLGLMPLMGGRHLSKGTHNAIIKTGHSSYLEILAPDPSNKSVLPPRWMGVDLLDRSKITRWAIKSTNIEEDAVILKSHHFSLGNIENGTRALEDNTILTWQLTDPLSYPEVEVIPFLLDWQDSVHPTLNMVQQCELIDIELSHPRPHDVSHTLEKLNLNLKVNQGNKSKISITLDTPKGIIKLE